MDWQEEVARSLDFEPSYEWLIGAVEARGHMTALHYALEGYFEHLLELSKRQVLELLDFCDSVEVLGAIEALDGIRSAVNYLLGEISLLEFRAACPDAALLWEGDE